MCDKGIPAGSIALIIIFVLVLMPLADAQSGGSVTKSQTFTVTVVGRPNTAYYVWLKGTFSLSGEPGEQPPIILPDQENIVQDPSDGPYRIGTYQYYGGGGRTILDDVAPSTSTLPNTSYYAQVTTDSNGYGIVAFRTSPATAARAFSIVAQNPASPGQDVAVALGVPTPVPTPVAALPAASILPTPLSATTMTTTPVPAVQSTPMAKLSPANVRGPVTTLQHRTPLPALIGIAAAGFVVLARAKNKR
jgi:hypothetical protein